MDAEGVGMGFGRKLTVAQAVVSCLEAECVKYVFGYPGAHALMLYDALSASSDLQFILSRHEQAAVHEADGYARATGDIGVVMVTSGPGATNAVTGIATAYMDSVPLVVITGQVPRCEIGTDSFQESDIVGITIPIVKHSYLLQDAAELPKVMREAFFLARTGRPGPVLVDIPSDLFDETILFEYPFHVNLRSYRPTYRGNSRQVRHAAEYIRNAVKPVLCVGGGVLCSGATGQLIALAEMMGIPVVYTLMGKGCIPDSHPLCYGMVGMHGMPYANKALRDSDLIIAVGMRFSNRATGRPESFAPHADLIHIDIDPAEIGKVREAAVPIVGDAKEVLASLAEILSRTSSSTVSAFDAVAFSVTQDGSSDARFVLSEGRAEWLEYLSSLRDAFAKHRLENVCDIREEIDPSQVISLISDMLDPDDSIVVTDVGQHQMWAAQGIKRSHPRTFLTSGGLGTMGYGLPASLGAWFGRPEASIVCISGDGSFQMNSQEMALASYHDIPVKVVIFDNSCLGMVHQWQRRFCDSRFFATEMDGNPSFTLLGEAYGWKARRVESSTDLAQALAWLMDVSGPALLDVVISRDCEVGSMSWAGSMTAGEE